jgi:hypothetical protein
MADRAGPLKGQDLYYVLDENNVAVPCDPSDAEAVLASRDKRRVGKDEGAGWMVSTVFLAIDHQYSSGLPPLLFETMVFMTSEDGQRADPEPVNDEHKLHESCWRYTTWEEARAGHAAVTRAVRMLYEGTPDQKAAASSVIALGDIHDLIEASAMLQEQLP